MPTKLSTLLADPARPFIHRDLSWLQFNTRVLAEAADPETPLLERARFLGISYGNLDEFFMIRMAALQRKLSTLPADSSSQLPAIAKHLLTAVKKLSKAQANTFENLQIELASSGILFLTPGTKNQTEQKLGEQLFRKFVLPYCETIEPFAKSWHRESENLQLSVLFPNNMVLYIPQHLPLLFWSKQRGGGVVVAFLDTLLQNYLGKALGIEGEPLVLRLTRDADVRVELPRIDPESIPEVVRKQINTRQTRRAVRLQWRGNTQLLPKVLEQLKLPDAQVFPIQHSLCLHGVSSLATAGESEFKAQHLLYPKLKPFVLKEMSDHPHVFQRIDERDFLFHQPYDSFDNYVHFIQAAAQHPQVVSIQQTVYRADALSPVTSLLKQAATRCKVRVVIEPRARFDEINNVRLAEELDSAGVEVVYASGSLKLHAKMALVTLEQGGELRRYSHLSTGNYNARTARQYTDLALLTANAQIGLDVERFFSALSKQQTPDGLKHLILAPTGLHRKISSAITAEIQAAQEGKSARIFAKVNALVDEKIIEQLYAASQAGVKIDLLVRGACSLIPGVAGLSDNIQVLSIVDRYLEHSRVYSFQNSGTVYFSSADWMPRNFFSRLEIAFPILDSRLKQYLMETLIPTYLDDRAKARRLTRLGSWRHRSDASKRAREGEPRAQQRFYELAHAGYKGTALE